LSFKLVLTKKVEEEKQEVGNKSRKKRSFGEDVFLANLPGDCRVYLWYYAGPDPNEELVAKLKKLGIWAGKALFVNLATPQDPNYPELAAKFGGIETFPTIVVTAAAQLASLSNEDSTSYVKIDNKALLNNTNLAYDCLEKIYNLYDQGKLAEALHEKNHDVLKARFRNFLVEALKGIRGFLKEWDVSFSFMTGTLQIKPREDKND
jgi:hypothetical protein